MEPRWLILVSAVAAHSVLVLTLFPRYWEPIERSGRKWPNLVVQVLIPMSFATILAAQLLDHWQSLTGVVLLLGSLGIGAATATVAIALSRLRSLGA